MCGAVALFRRGEPFGVFSRRLHIVVGVLVLISSIATAVLVIWT
ncbi:MAG: hypothetical protein ACE5O2_00015 [Armatimonadota bacterium]